MKRLIIFLIEFYQKNISPLKPSSCRFTPTCSNYAKEAILKRGVIIGSILTIGRILRCNPLFKGGYDPVPLSKKEKEWNYVWYSFKTIRIYFTTIKQFV